MGKEPLQFVLATNQSRSANNAAIELQRIRMMPCREVEDVVKADLEVDVEAAEDEEDNKSSASGSKSNGFSIAALMSRRHEAEESSSEARQRLLCFAKAKGNI